MDSEQLVSNPFQDMVNENADIHKGPSLTQKLTAVKNNICEKHLDMVENVLEHKKSDKLKEIHEESCKLQYKVKLMDIDRRKNELITKKRIEPKKDFSYDNNQIWNAEKRLGINTESFYTQKNLSYPLRAQMKRDHTATSFIIKVREMLQQKKEDEHKIAETLPSTPYSAASSQEQFQSQGSKSAPPIPKLQQDNIYAVEENVRLPNISRESLKQPSRVKFSVLDSNGNAQSLYPDKIIRAHTFHFGSIRRKSVWDSDSDEDSSIPEKVDLRALFFGEKTIDNRSTGTPAMRHSSSAIPSLRRSQQAQPPTQEMLIEESHKLRVKVDSFLETLDPQGDVKKEPEPIIEEVKKVKVPIPVVMDKSKTILNIFSKPLDPKYEAWKNVDKGKKTDMNLESMSLTSNDGQRIQSAVSYRERIGRKNLWEYIKGPETKVNLRQLYTPDELLLQRMTGISLGKKQRSVIPLHSASRALRYTPTYKLRSVLKTLMSNRTKFQKQEENLKCKTDDDNQERINEGDDDDDDDKSSVISKA